MSLVPIDLGYATGARLITNGLVENPSVADLDQDLVLVELPDDLFIDVSWYPENESPGAYYVTVFRGGSWEHPLTEMETSSPDSAASLVAMLASLYTVPSGPIACATESQSTFVYTGSAA